MQDVITESLAENKVLYQTTIDYSEVLDTYGLKYISREFYWQVGEIQKVQGWILHLSVIKLQFIKLLHTIIPELLPRGIPFKIVRDSNTADNQLNGTTGYINLGKMISIYPSTDEEALTVAKQLIELTFSFCGPSIPTDRHLGNIVYTRYGSFNAVQAKSSDGRSVKCIYNTQGQLIPDPYSTPFAAPQGISWPFSELVSSIVPKPGKLLNDAYYTIGFLKQDPKGDVIKALYFKQFWNIKTCIIKQARQNILSDEAGRDIRDRLKWQYKLYQELQDEIPMPQIFQQFQKEDDIYLAMQFIKGISFTNWITNKYRDRRWPELSIFSRVRIVNYLLEIISIIQRLHKKGFIHRDITPENFLLDKEGRIYLIDLELAWSIHSKQPDPPFRLGTHGFMSPEQFNGDHPTIKDDVFALGGFMLVLFTNLSPVKFSIHTAELKKTLLFLTGEQKLADWIAGCMQVDPAKRSDLTMLKNSIAEWKSELQQPSTNSTIPYPLDESDLCKMQSKIQSGIWGLSSPGLQNSCRYWVSRMVSSETVVPGNSLVLTLSDGWHTGMAGPIWLLAKAKHAGFNVDSCDTPFKHSWHYIRNHILKIPADSFTAGLYNGRAGIALSIVEALDADMLLPDESTIKHLEQCFAAKSHLLDLSGGVAGQGISLLRCALWLDKIWAKHLLNDYVNTILGNQLANGSWNILSSSGKQNDILMGLDKGIAGIVWFLLAYLELYPDEKVRASCIKSLNWFITKARRKTGAYLWNISTKSRSFEQWSCSVGIPGIILLFIRAYEILGDPIYRKIAEINLKFFPSTPVIPNCQLGMGLTGLGEVYLEAFRVFKNPLWKERAAWIARLLDNTCQLSNDNAAFWITTDSNIATADLFTGMSGILHFLIRYTSKLEIPCHLLPHSFKTKKNNY